MTGNGIMVEREEKCYSTYFGACMELLSRRSQVADTGNENHYELFRRIFVKFYIWDFYEYSSTHYDAA